MSEQDKLPIGTRIKFIKTLDCGPTSAHPALLYAEKGSKGEVTGHTTSKFGEGHMVKTDSWPTSFGARFRTEFVEDK